MTNITDVEVFFERKLAPRDFESATASVRYKLTFKEGDDVNAQIEAALVDARTRVLATLAGKAPTTAEKIEAKKEILAQSQARAEPETSVPMEPAKPQRGRPKKEPELPSGVDDPFNTPLADDAAEFDSGEAEVVDMPAPELQSWLSRLTKEGRIEVKEVVAILKNIGKASNIQGLSQEGREAVIKAVKTHLGE